MATRKKTAAAATPTPAKLADFFAVASLVQELLGPDGAKAIKYGGSSNNKGSKFDEVISLSLQDYLKIANQLDEGSFTIEVTITGSNHQAWKPSSQGSIAPAMLAQLGLPNQ